ncbi:hypothetical protein ACQKFJ_30185, partial [Bacillus mycoides]
MESVLCCDQIKGLVGENVKVNLRGPESRVGVLVSLGKDYLTLQLPLGELVYYQLKHVKSLYKSSLKNRHICTLNTTEDCLRIFINRFYKL